ncbi:MAG: NTP transferase domain-containing protein [Bacilli bacterium]|nr:NTP transferase domain-containing protein [Bacilli bacterium]MDD4076929.1 NTP transferase domain-containing protein [Bacilli bacterium]MDD4388080.1 NTP transferase domain-containing protein [Bacilli bacterium]
MNVNAIILAAGKGTRMNSDAPKCAHIIIDKPMVEYVYDSVSGAGIKDIITIVGYKKEVIERILAGKCKFAVQEQQLGTAHAVLMAEKYLKDKEGLTLIAIGDMPFISKDTYAGLIGNHMQNKADLTVLTTEHPEPYGYGRIIRNDNDEIVEIVEEKDCDKYQRRISEINASVYVVDNKKLFLSLHLIKRKNYQNEYYLTDIVKYFNQQGHKTNGYKISDFHQISGVNDQIQLVEMEEILRQKIIRKHLMNGVAIHSPHTVIIGQDVKIENGSIIYPGSIIVKKTLIGKNTEIGPYSIIDNAVIKEGTQACCSYIKDSTIVEGSKIGPYAKIVTNITE